MKAKYKLYLTDSVYAVMSIDISIPTAQRMAAEAVGIGDQEQTNLVGQKMQEILSLLGNTGEV